MRANADSLVDFVEESPIAAWIIWFILLTFLAAGIIWTI